VDSVPTSPHVDPHPTPFFRAIAVALSPTMTFFKVSPALLSLLLGAACCGAVAIRANDQARGSEFGGASPLQWSERLAKSEIAREGDSMFYADGRTRARWDYTTSLFGLSLLKLADVTGNKSYADYGARTATSFVKPDGSIATYKSEDYNIDMIPPGKVLLYLWDQGQHEPRYRTALETLRAQMGKHPRTSDGGFWHKQRYPYQMWLDGLFMASPFLAHYAKTFGEPALFDDVAHQIILMDQHGYDPKTGLHYHAWDEKRAQSWANKETGTSPNFWGRAEGWYAMAIVDSLDYFSPTHPDVEHLNEILRRVADGIVRWQDPKSGLWWQVMDQGSREGNYLEATASSMFVYALAKGVNRGYLSREKYLPAIRRGYEGIVRDLLRTDAKGAVSLTRCCSVAGLGYTAANGRPRDGTFDYYVSEPIVDNDLKGIGPLILAGLEVEQLLSNHPTTPIAIRGWSDYESLVARIRAPSFPDRDFPITEFGAKPGEDASKAVTAAIDACHTAGGGRVVVPPGEWLTGAIQLKSNVNLHISAGATLRWKFDPANHPVVFTRWEGVECFNYSALIYAFEAENIAVTGKGTLDGGADWSTWWSWNKKNRAKAAKADLARLPPEAFASAEPLQKKARDNLNQMGETGAPVEQRRFGEGSYLRPNFIQSYRCKNILIEDVSIVRSPMWELHPVLSQNITIRGVKISTHGPNNDGCDPESSSDILLENCTFDTGDDCIAIKSGRNNDGRRVNVPTENMIIRSCTMKDGHGGVVLGSECSGGIRNIFVENCTMDSPSLDRVLRLKSNATRGGVLENIFMRNVTVGRVSEAILTVDLLYEEGAKGGFQPVVRNIQLENITSSGSPRVMFIRGLPNAVVENIRISRSTFNNVTEPEVVQHAGSITLDRVSITPPDTVRSLNSNPAPAN
jgi:unsaturated rhamnogalacturonyl hydrolase